MKRRYQIDQQRAVQQFRQLAREENPNLQMIFPMAEVVGLLGARSAVQQNARKPAAGHATGHALSGPLLERCSNGLTPTPLGPQPIGVATSELSSSTAAGILSLTSLLSPGGSR